QHSTRESGSRSANRCRDPRGPCPRASGSRSRRITRQQLHRLFFSCAPSSRPPNQRHMRGEKIMPSTQNAVNNHEYRSVPITALAESASNPRKRFDAKSLEELAASFKTQGILAPLLVRELEESKYEVVAGARRLR